MTPEEINVVDLNSRGQITEGNIFTTDYTNSVESGNVKWILEKKETEKELFRKEKSEKLLIKLLILCV